MNKGEIVSVLTAEFDGRVSRVEVDDAVTSLFGKMAQSLTRRETVKLYGIGSLQLVDGAARMCRNVIENTPLRVPPKTRVRFTASRMLKKKLERLDEQNKFN